MNTSNKLHKILLSGGGTGGHIYPAIAIANEIKKRLPNAEFLFVGAKDKMEMEKVPKAGYTVKGLWISGINRRQLHHNLAFPLKLGHSLWTAHQILNEFKPDICIGTGGFASGPTLWAASQKDIPIYLQEQNAFPGITNKLLRKRAEKIFVAYDGMSKYFPEDKLHLTGNPIRTDLFSEDIDSKKAKEHFGLNPDLPVILSVGGSLGAQTLNNTWEKHFTSLSEENIQLLWQCGKSYDTSRYQNTPNLFISEFIYEMNLAYAAADIIVSRAGAMAIAELCMIGKPTILVPFPFAAENHQTRNAEYLEQREAAICIPDHIAEDDIVPQIKALMNNQTKMLEMGKNCKALAKPNATKTIVDFILDL